jgi:hypothetical protein
MKKVMIGTPCYDGKIDVWYAHSLMNTIKMSKEKDVEIFPLWVSFDALIQRARNDTVQTAIEMDVDELIWIDSDIEWQPEWFFKLLEHPVDVVGGTYPKKGDKEEYVIHQTQRKIKDPVTGLIEVDGLGTGFVRMNRTAIQYLWNSSVMYIDPKDNKERRMIFDVEIRNYKGTPSMYSEDIIAFLKLKEGGFKIWMDATMTCNHIGQKKYIGNFEKWYNKVSISKKQL